MKHYNLGDIDNIPATGEPLGPELIAQLEKLGTNISEKMNLLDFKSNNGNTVLWGPLDEEKDGKILDFFKFHSAFTYVMGRGITQEEVDKYDEYICKQASKKKKSNE
jgi:hypothetical protein